MDKRCPRISEGERCSELHRRRLRRQRVLRLVRRELRQPRSRCLCLTSSRLCHLHDFSTAILTDRCDYTCAGELLRGSRILVPGDLGDLVRFDCLSC